MRRRQEENELENERIYNFIATAEEKREGGSRASKRGKIQKDVTTAVEESKGEEME